MCPDAFYIHTHIHIETGVALAEKLAICCRLVSTTLNGDAGCSFSLSSFPFFLFFLPFHFWREEGKVLSTSFSFVCHKAAIIQVPCTYRSPTEGRRVLGRSSITNSNKTGRQGLISVPYISWAPIFRFLFFSFSFLRISQCFNIDNVTLSALILI